VLVIGAAERDELVRLRQEALQAMALKRDASNEASADSGNSRAAPRRKVDRPNGRSEFSAAMRDGLSPARKEGHLKLIASMPQISRVSEGWAYDACPRLRGKVSGRWRVKLSPWRQVAPQCQQPIREMLFRRIGLLIEMTNANENELYPQLAHDPCGTPRTLAVYAGNAFCEITGL
jgi:hypothetical protein